VIHTATLLCGDASHIFREFQNSTTGVARCKIESTRENIRDIGEKQLIIQRFYSLMHAMPEYKSIPKVSLKISHQNK
jgi:hypothetical protein